MNDISIGFKIWNFFKPTTIKLVFLIEWTMFLGILAVSGQLKSNQQILVACYPLLFFYLIACTISQLSQCVQFSRRDLNILILTLGLVGADQIIKMAVFHFIPYQFSMPILNGWLHLAHKRNFYGSWLANSLDLPLVTTAIMIFLVVILLLPIIVSRRYYAMHYRESLFADVAFLGFFAGMASWLYDMVCRGFVIDYINLPSVVTTDFKDILLYFGAAALVAETLDNPSISYRWKGWKREKQEVLNFCSTFTHFFIHELDRIRQLFLVLKRKIITKCFDRDRRC